MPILPVLCLGSEFLHPWAWNVKPLAKGVNLPFFPVSPLIIVFVLFPSMGVWAIRTRLRYYIQPCEQPEIEVTSGSTVRSHVYQAAQRLHDQRLRSLRSPTSPRSRGSCLKLLTLYKTQNPSYKSICRQNPERCIFCLDREHRSVLYVFLYKVILCDSKG
jgi:hypothetical protein